MPLMLSSYHSFNFISGVIVGTQAFLSTAVSVRYMLLYNFQYFPCKKSQTNKKKAPWMTYKAVKLINKKRKTYRV